MTRYKENISELVEKDSHLCVVLGDDANYIVRGFGATSLQLESKDMLHLSDVLYVPGKEILSPSLPWRTRDIKLHFQMGKYLLGTRTQAWTRRKKLE